MATLMEAGAYYLDVYEFREQFHRRTFYLVSHMPLQGTVQLGKLHDKTYLRPTSKRTSVNGVKVRLYWHPEDRRPGPRKTDRDVYRPLYSHVLTDLGCG
jgi:hypothetical protein